MKSINYTNKSYVIRNFSDFDSSTQLDEAFDFLKGKERLYGDVRNAIKIAIDNANSKLSTPGMKENVGKTINTLNGISKELEGKDPKSIERSDYRKYLDSVKSAEDEISKKEIEILKKNGVFNDVLKIIEEASGIAEEARKKGDEVKIEVSKKRDEKESKIELKLSKTLKKDEVKGKSKEIEKIQAVFLKKFESNPKVKDSKIFKKIKDAVENKKQGGFFGPTTEKIIKGLKAGFGMDDKTSDITQDLIDKIYTEKIEESRGFLNYGLINEDFDANKFLEIVGERDKEKELPSTKEVLDAMDKSTEEIYDKNKEGIDYILGKDFEPTEEGEENFETIFGVKWDDFRKYDDKQKKNVLASGFKSNLIPLTKDVNKDVIDLYFKKEETE